MLNDKVYEALSNAFDRSIDTGRLMGARKSVLMSGVEKLGYMGTILVYKKANLSEVRKGQQVAKGWIVEETIQNPKNKKDGLVICVRDPHAVSSRYGA